jgi:hypothetical protein
MLGILYAIMQYAAICKSQLPLLAHYFGTNRMHLQKFRFYIQSDEQIL